MSYFSAFGNNLANGIAGSLVGSAESYVSSAAQRAVSKVTSRMAASFGGGSYSGLNSEMSNSKAILKMAMRIKYAQGWQWNVEIDGFSGLDMYVKDMTYGFGNIETESTMIGSVEFQKPTHATAGMMTLTVRDNEAREIRQWFMQRKSLVTNTDGTLNLPMQYLMNARIYSVSQDGEKTLLESVQVFPTQLGECSFARDMLTEFCTYPLTFMRYTSAENSIGGIVSNAVAGAVSGAVKSVATDTVGKLRTFI